METTQEWRKKDGRIQFVETTVTTVERILVDYSVEEYDAQAIAQQKAIDDFDAKKHIAEMKKGLDEFKAIKVLAVDIKPLPVDEKK